MVVNGKSGKPLNCISSIYPNGEVPEPEPVAVDPLEAEEAQVVATSYFDLQGRRIAAPARGLSICCEQLSDGSVRSKKILTK